MKKSILMMLVFVIISVFRVNAQQTYIVVAIAKQKTNCNIKAHLGYSIKYGKVEYVGTGSYQLSKSADEEVKRNNPNYDDVLSRVDNYMSETHYLGSYMIIISANVSRPDGCTWLNYGVGFGTDRDSALRDAKAFLSGISGFWSEKKHGYSVVEDKQY
jgi:hypothetical protein